MSNKWCSHLKYEDYLSTLNLLCNFHKKLVGISTYQPSYAHIEWYIATAIEPALVAVPENPVDMYWV